VRSILAQGVGGGLTWVMAWGCCGLGAPRAGWEGSVMRVVVSRDTCGRWMLMVAGGGWMVNPGRLGRERVEVSDQVGVAAGVGTASHEAHG